MSTRANVIIKDEYDKLIFYRHSDGYPDGALPTLMKFLNWVHTGKLRPNVKQSAGWLVLIGAKEYNKGYEPDEDGPSSWKCGSYEPTPYLNDDINYQYTIDLVDETLEVDNVATGSVKILSYNGDKISWDSI